MPTLCHRQQSAIGNSRAGLKEAIPMAVLCLPFYSSATSASHHTMRFGSAAKVLLKCKLKYYRISECISDTELTCFVSDADDAVLEAVCRARCIPCILPGQEILPGD